MNKPNAPKITKKREAFLYPLISLEEFSIIWPEIRGQRAIAKFSNTNIIPKADPVIFLLTTTGIAGIIQFA